MIETLTRSLTASLTHYFVTQSLAHAVIHSLAHSVLRSLTHARTQSFSHSVTCSLTHTHAGLFSTQHTRRPSGKQHVCTRSLMHSHAQVSPRSNTHADHPTSTSSALVCLSHSRTPVVSLCLFNQFFVLFLFSDLQLAIPETGGRNKHRTGSNR